MPTYNQIRDIVIGKLVDKTIDDDYTGLSELLFGEGNKFSESEVRKRMYGMLSVVNAVESEREGLFTSSDVFTELEARKIEMQIEKQKLQDQRREFQKSIRDSARGDHITETLLRAAHGLNKAKPLSFSKGEIAVADGSDEGLVILNDWHYGMTTKNIWNTFDTAVCRARVERFVNEVKKKIRLHNLGTVHVLILGDMAHGAIHTSARVASEELVCEQLMNVSEMIAEAICEIADLVENVYVYSTFGNHMRTVQDKNDSIHADNMERIIPWWLKTRLSYRDDIKVIDNEYYEFLKLNIMGYNICAVHGDLDNVRKFGVTSNTIFSKRYGETIDYTIVADKHHLEEFEGLGIESLLVGSLCGSDEYANAKRLYSAPRQTMITFNKDSGRDAVYHIRLN